MIYTATKGYPYKNLQSFFSLNDPPPEYLLIIGDVNRIPYYGSGEIRKYH